MSKLIINDLSCQRGYNQLFTDLSFELNAGEILRISGSNGSGKTSLLKILAGLNSPESGFISYNENDIKSYQYQLDTLYLGHLPALSPELKCMENLKYLTHLSNEDSKSNFDLALSKAGLESYKNELTGTLSAGQKRRVALSALFLSHSKLWLLDEPFTALDSYAIEIIENQIIKHCNEGGLCVLTTHQDCNIKNLKELAL